MQETRLKFVIVGLLAFFSSFCPVASVAGTCSELFLNLSLEPSDPSLKAYYRNAIRAFERVPEAELQGIMRPTTTQEKVAFFEVLIEREIAGTTLVSAVNSKTSDHLSKSLSKIAKGWQVDKGITFEQVFKFTEAIFQKEGPRFLSPSTWLSSLPPPPSSADMLLRQRWDTEVMAQSIFKFLESSQIVPVSREPARRSGIFRLLRIPLGILFTGMPSYEPTRSEKLRMEIDQAASEIETLGTEAAFQKFAARHRNLANTEIYASWFRKISNLVMATSLFWSLGVSVDSTIVPVELIWTSHTQAITKLVDLADREYQHTYGQPMSPGMRRMTEVGKQRRYEDASLRELLYFVRSQSVKQENSRGHQ